MSTTRAQARELLDRFNALSDDYLQLVNQVLDQAIDDEQPLDLSRTEVRLQDLKAKFEALDRDVDSATKAAGLEPLLA